MDDRNQRIDARLQEWEDADNAEMVKDEEPTPSFGKRFARQIIDGTNTGVSILGSDNAEDGDQAGMIATLTLVAKGMGIDVTQARVHSWCDNPEAIKRDFDEALERRARARKAHANRARISSRRLARVAMVSRNDHGRAAHGLKTCSRRRGSTTRSSAASGDSGKPRLPEDGEPPQPSRRPSSRDQAHVVTGQGTA